MLHPPFRPAVQVTKYMKQSSKTTVTNHSAKVRRVSLSELPLSQPLELTPLRHTLRCADLAAFRRRCHNHGHLERHVPGCGPSAIGDPRTGHPGCRHPIQADEDPEGVWLAGTFRPTSLSLWLWLRTLTHPVLVLQEGQKQNAFKAKFQALMGTGDEAGGEGGDSAAAGAGTAYSEKAQQAISQMQQRMSGGVTDTSFEQQGCTIRISSLSKAASRDDVRELCQNFGRVTRCSVPRDKEGESRGYAYCDFSSPEEAQRAIKGLDGYGYDYLILSVSLVENRASDPQRTSMRHATGYGKALPQS